MDIYEYQLLMWKTKFNCISTYIISCNWVAYSEEIRFKKGEFNPLNNVISTPFMLMFLFDSFTEGQLLPYPTWQQRWLNYDFIRNLREGRFFLQ